MKTLDSRDVDTFREQGFLLIRRLVDADEIAQLRGAFDSLLALAALGVLSLVLGVRLARVEEAQPARASRARLGPRPVSSPPRG